MEQARSKVKGQPGEENTSQTLQKLRMHDDRKDCGTLPACCRPPTSTLGGHEHKRRENEAPGTSGKKVTEVRLLPEEQPLNVPSLLEAGSSDGSRQIPEAPADSTDPRGEDVEHCWSMEALQDQECFCAFVPMFPSLTLIRKQLMLRDQFFWLLAAFDKNAAGS